MEKFLRKERSETFLTIILAGNLYPCNGDFVYLAISIRTNDYVLKNENKKRKTLEKKLGQLFYHENLLKFN